MYLLNLQAPTPSPLCWFSLIAHVSSQLQTYSEIGMEGVLAQNNTPYGPWTFPSLIWATRRMAATSSSQE